MLTDKKITNVPLYIKKVQNSSIANVLIRDWKVDGRLVHAEEDQTLPDDAFPSTEYFIELLDVPLERIPKNRQIKLSEEVALLNVCLRCASESWLLSFKQQKGFLKLEIFARAVMNRNNNDSLQSQVVQIGKTLIYKKEASICCDLFKSILNAGLVPAKSWRSPIFSGNNISAMVPILKTPYCSKKRSLDILLLLFQHYPDIAKRCLMDCLSEWVNDLEMVTWELSLDSTIIKIRTNNLFYRLAYNFGNYLNHDHGVKTSREILSSYVLAHLNIYNHILGSEDIILPSDQKEKMERCLSKLTTLPYQFLHENISKMAITIPGSCKI